LFSLSCRAALSRGKITRLCASREGDFLFQRRYKWGLLKLRYLLGIPTQVVVPSVSCVAVLQGFAGTIFMAIPSGAGCANPVVDSAVP
jgi:hypothetical protein